MDGVFNDEFVDGILTDDLTAELNSLVIYSGGMTSSRRPSSIATSTATSAASTTATVGRLATVGSQSYNDVTESRVKFTRPTRPVRTEWAKKVSCCIAGCNL